MLRDVGAFRTITAESLRKHLYQGDEERFKKDLSNLTDQRLVTVQPDSKGKRPLRLAYQRQERV